ncbi:MAG: PAS domain S-box protein [Flavobacteriales bacterium]|nr:PAS domain S-box protein [Flavobacteriales bacterium]
MARDPEHSEFLSDEDDGLSGAHLILKQSNRAKAFLLASSQILAEAGAHHGDTLQRLAEFASEYFDAVCNISVSHPGEHVIRPIALHHRDRRVNDAIRSAFERNTVKVGEGMVGKVMADGVDIIQFSASKKLRERTAAFSPHIVPESIMYLPLRTGRGILGVINLVRLEGSPAFIEQDVDLMRRLTVHVALFLDNAWLRESQAQELELRKQAQEELEKANATGAFLLKVSRLLSDLHTERSQVLQSLTEEVAGHFNVFCVIYVMNADGVGLRPRAFYHRHEDVRTALKEVFEGNGMEDGLHAARHVTRTGNPFIFKDAAAGKAGKLPMDPKLNPKDYGFWPLKGVEPIGAICLCRLQQDDALTVDEVNRAAQLATHLSLFLENMQLHDRQQLEIAARQAAEQRLTRNESDLRTILNAIPINISRVSKDLHYRFLNASYRKMGIDPEDLLGQHIVNLLGEEGLLRIGPRIEKVLAGEMLNYDEQLILSNGSQRHYNVVIAPDFDDKGNVQGFYSCTVDSTAKMEAERELRLSEERYRSLLLHSGDAFCLHRFTGEILDVNEFATELLGYDRDELLSMNINRIDRGWFRPEYPELLAKISPDTPVTFDTSLVHKDGRSIPVEVRFVKRVEEGEVLIQALVRDRTEKHRQQEQLRKSEEWLRFLFENVNDVILGLHWDGTVLSINRPQQGYSVSDVVGSNIYHSMEASVALKLQENLALSSETGQPFEMMMRHLGADGTYEWYHTHYCPVESREMLICVSRNITHMKESELQVMNGMTIGQEQERRRLGAELHDGVGQILSSIALELSQMRESKACNDDVRSRMQELGDRVTEAINEVRNISHDLMPGLLDSFGLAHAVREVCRNMQARAGISIIVDSVDMDTEYPEAVQTHLYRITQELITNCVRHAHCTRVHVNLIDHGDMITLSVEDDGIGFNTEEKVNGIGLRNVRSRASILGGTLSVESSGTSGTLVLVEIPKYQEDGKN